MARTPKSAEVQETSTEEETPKSAEVVIVNPNECTISFGGIVVEPKGFCTLTENDLANEKVMKQINHGLITGFITKG